MLKQFTRFDAPPKVVKRKKGVGTACYGFGDASGKGFGFALELNGKVLSEYGQWEATIEEKHSNYKELRNLVNVVKLANEQGDLDDCELYIFTDNMTTESAYYNGGSNTNRELDDLVFTLCELQMTGNFSLFVYHVAGTRMIQSGIDKLSCGDKAEGISLGLSLGTFIPIHLNPLDQSLGLLAWIRSWWNDVEFGKLELSTPEGWFDNVIEVGNWVWNVPAAAGEAAIELLCDHVHG